MVARVWTKSLATVALLIIAGASSLSCVSAQQMPASGSLAGKLTDPHSSPLVNMTVTLRNAATGVEVRTTTSRGGSYHFSGLAEGEYTLTAAGSLGSGAVNGIYVAAGHEAHVQTAIELAPQPHEFAGPAKVPELTAPSAVESSPTPRRSVQVSQFQTPQFQASWIAAVAASPVEASFEAEPFTLLPLNGTTTALPELPAPPASTFASAPPIAVSLEAPVVAMPSVSMYAPAAPPNLSVAMNEAALTPVLDLPTVVLSSAVVAVEVGLVQASVLGARHAPKAQIAALESASLSQSSQSLDSTQLQALPLPGRNWQNFVLDTPPDGDGDGREQEAPARTGAATEITVDGARTQSAFGNTNGGRSRYGESAQMGAGTTDTAVRELQPAEEGGVRGGLGRLNVVTQRGTEHLHGQAFLFDRQGLWGARNPFTQWVKETAPASSATIPVFTPEAYSPSDRELLWGAGLGGEIHKHHLFWFGAVDGNERNDPGVATVKHPDNFFAQPTNDQMQLLSAQLGLNGADPVGAGIGAYSKLLESLGGLVGPAPRTSSQWAAFGRADWSVAERHRFTLEASGGRLNSPGGGFTRASAIYGTHSFGVVHVTQQWALARWEAFITPNLLAVTQGSYGHHVQSASAETPSPFEQSLNISAWGQLPQIVVDSRYGFTIGNPARFGRGNYPDEHLYMAQEQLNWVHKNLMLKAGLEFGHNTDATTRLRNQTGTYHYSSIEDFASDALAFSAFGVSGQLNPMNQHNCDQTGRAWRDSSGVLHGLGYLPCYSWYSQTMGPSNWWLSTNDWAGYMTSQWHPAKSIALTAAVRWELEQLPPAISMLQNPDLPGTERMPALGSQWGPRAGFAWGTGESRWPVIRFGYGMYFSRTRNAVVESALTQTGSMKGDLNFFMRPTDNLNAGGAPPFPYVLAGEPASVVKPAAVEFGPGFRNGEIQQAEAAVEKILPGHIYLEADAVASLGRRLPVTFDANINSTADAKTITYAITDGTGMGPIKSPRITVPFFASWPSISSPTGFAGRLNPNYQQVSEVFSRANSTYEAAMLRISRNGRALTLRARYTYAHAMDWNPDEASQVGGPSVLDPIDFQQEYGTSNLDVRHSLTTAAIMQPRWKLNNLAGRIANGWTLSATAYFHSGLPYTMRTAGSLAKEFTVGGAAIVALGTGMNGYGGDNRVYGVGRNTYRYPSTWKSDLRLGKRFDLGQMRQLELMAESFNLFNHQNVTELETTGYTIESGTANGGLPRLNFLAGLKTGQTEFGKPLNINATDFYRQRQIQFGARFRF